LTRHPPRTTRFPSPPLFRPRRPPVERRVRLGRDRGLQQVITLVVDAFGGEVRLHPASLASPATHRGGAAGAWLGSGAGRVEECRSEEHTSELQSRENLVCRL